MSRLLFSSAGRTAAARTRFTRRGWFWAALTGPLALGSCTIEDEPLFEAAEPLAPLAGSNGNLPSFSQRPSGSGGRTGAAAGAGGGEGNTTGVVQPAQSADGGLPDPEPGSPSDADAAPAGGADAGSDAGRSCESASECDDANACTLDACTLGSCEHTPASAGVACGSATESECTRADSCDGEGRCAPNDLPADTACGSAAATCRADACDGLGSCAARTAAADTPCGVSNGCGQPTCNAGGECVPNDTPNGSACPGGSCSVGSCIAGQRVGCPRAVVTMVPFETTWSSAGLPDLFEGECQSDDTPDFAIVFVVPATGRYRFEATGSPDSVLTLANGACSVGNGAQIDPCNDDIDDDNRDSRVEVTLAVNQTITIYVSEFGEENSGQGTLRVTPL